MIVDSISDMATIIRNAIAIKNSLVTLPYTKNNEIIAKILAKEGFIHCVVRVGKFHTSTNKTYLKKNEKIPASQNNATLNHEKTTNLNAKEQKTSEKNRLNDQKVIILALKYVGREKKPLIHAIKRVSKPSLRWYSQNPIPQSLGGLGIFIVSTSSGIITDKEAREKKIGGEILLEIW
nr:ribosomal protein S8 [Trentepohlia sp. YN1242]